MDAPLKQNQGDQKFKCNQLNIEVILVAIYSSTFSKSQFFFKMCIILVISNTNVIV